VHFSFSKNKYQKCLFLHFYHFLAAGFCPKNLAFVRKMMVLPEMQPLSPACPPMLEGGADAKLDLPTPEG